MGKKPRDFVFARADVSAQFTKEQCGVSGFMPSSWACPLYVLADLAVVHGRILDVDEMKPNSRPAVPNGRPNVQILEAR